MTASIVSVKKKTTVKITLGFIHQCVEFREYLPIYLYNPFFETLTINFIFRFDMEELDSDLTSQEIAAVHHEAPRAAVPRYHGVFTPG